MSTNHITLKSARQALRMSKRELYSRDGHDRTFPAMIRLPNGGIVFDQGEIDSWARANPRPGV